jgi:YVTN family beta-propeller protein/uncharacterized repeat protein (TIGR03803 family)
MNSATQNRSWISVTCGRTATIALASAIIFVAAVFATGLAQAQTFATLADFQGSTNGAEPLYGYPIISGGYGYGTTVGGGAYDEGTVFQATSDGTVTTLYSFCSQVNCTDGAEPFSGLVVAGGNFYGTTHWGGLYGKGTVFELTPAGQLTTLHSFAEGPTDGGKPWAGLVEVGGNFYGTTPQGGAKGGGTVFEITPAGQLTILYSFCSQNNCSDGEDPYAGLVQAANGKLYGTTPYGGAKGGGTVFEITLAGQLTTLYSFCSQTNCSDGELPYAGLVQATNGNLYGTTVDGGAKGAGTVFEIMPAGQFTTLYNFCSLSGCSDGLFPYAGLVQASDGNLYGTTNGGSLVPVGAYSFGTVFGMTPGGQLTTLHSFGVTDGAYPYGGLVEGTGGGHLLYGATSYGGSQYNGTIFSLPVGLDPAVVKQASSRQAESKFALPNFIFPNFLFPRNDLPAATGITFNRTGPAFPFSPSARTLTAVPLQPPTARMEAAASGVAVPASGPEALTNVLNFDGANGAFPYLTSLIQGTDGNLYGTTDGGGTFDQGTVFQLTPGGTLTTIYTFCSQTNCTDGAEPLAGLVQATNGNFYGTTPVGGAIGTGTIFEITSAGQLTTLYNFCSQPGCADGNYSQAPLVQATNGNFYGTTYAGGVNGEGNVFEMTPAGQLTTLYSFCSQPKCTDGAYPIAGLVQATNGNLYGTTLYGGANGAGTVFEITPAGQLTTRYSFCSQTNCSDGEIPYAGLIQGANGNLYGTTESGGANGGGTVFEITPAGQLTTRYSFCSQSGCTDGVEPYGGLVQVSGNFYGMTSDLGPNGFGTVFEITPAGQLNTLYGFGLTDGAYPDGGLVQGSNGNLYGMTDFGGNRLGGTLFSLPPVITLSSPTGTAQVGVAYSSVLNAAGGVAPYTFSITSGALPPGLLLNSSTGAITGTPMTAGTYSFTAQVVDSKGNTAIASCGIVVTSASANPTTTSLSLVPSSIPVGSLGPIAMTATVTPVSGGGTPTGSVTYFNGSTQVETATLSGGVGTFNFNPSSLAVGIYSITAVYSGDSAFSASTSSPQTLAIIQNGPFAYVANQGSNTVSVINIPTGQVANNILVGSEPHGVAISPDGTQVYVSNILDNDVSVIDTATNNVIATIPVQSDPRGLVFTPDGTSVYVANRGSNSVSVINTASQTVVANVPVQSAPVGVSMALTSNGTFAYVANLGSNTVSVIAVGATPSVAQTINVGTAPNSVRVAPNSSLAYVENGGSNNVSVISVANNTVTATIPVGMNPYGIAFSPDSSTAYVTNVNSNTVSVIDAASSSVVNTVVGFNAPQSIALTTDGSAGYVTNNGANTVAVFATSTNTITGTITVGTSPANIRIASNPPTELQITMPLSPTQPNVFNFGAYNQAAQYPPGTTFSNVNMTTAAVEITPAQFQQRVAGTQFANATCIVYAGTGGNCVDFQVTCSNNSGNPIACPSEPEPTIAVQTEFSTAQAIINPGYLTTPIGENQWKNIFTGFSDPVARGRTQGFSEFVAVSLGASDPQKLAQFQILSPIFPVTYSQGQVIPISIQLTSVATQKPVSGAQASISVMMIANSNGNPTQQEVLSAANAFTGGSTGVYNYNLDATAYAAGIYIVTIYGDLFPAYRGQFTIQSETGAAVLVAKPTSLTFPDQFVGTFSATMRDSLFNEGSAQGIVSSVQTTGDFQIQTNECLNGVKPATHCDVYIVFSPTAVGTRTGTLTYYDNAQSGPQTVTLSGVGTLMRPTTTALSSSPNPSVYGQAVTFTAVVTSSVGAPPDGETVTFMKGETVLGTSTLVAGSASVATSTMPAGPNWIRAVYGGDSNFDTSTSKLLSQVVDKATSTTALASSLNPSDFGEPVIFTATVTPQFGGTPSGTVTFMNGSTELGTVSLSGGIARHTATKLAVGTQSITAVYNGGNSFTASTSQAVSQVINEAVTSTTLVSSLNPSTENHAVTFTARVTAPTGGTIPGAVSFYEGTTLLGTTPLTAELIGGEARFTTTTLTPGRHKITATYPGSTDFTGGSASLTQTVN